MHRLPAYAAAGALLLAASACSTFQQAASSRESAARRSADDWTRCATLPDGERAVYACRAVVRGNSQSVAAHRALAERLEVLERHREALRAREAVMRLAPEDATAALELAQAQERAGRPDDALRSYERFAELAPEEPRGHELVGWMRLEMGRFEEALDAFTRSTRAGRASANAHYGAALALAALYRRDEAMHSLRAAIDRDPERAEFWGQLAVHALALHRVDEAVDHWTRAASIDPTYFDRRGAERRQFEQARDQVGAATNASTATDETTEESSTSPAPSEASGTSAPSTPSASSAVPRSAAAEDEPSAAKPTPSAASSAVLVPRDRKREVLVGPDASGSGFMISRAGYVVTNKHVVRACRSVQVRVGESTLHPAEIVRVDPDDDLALLRVDATLPAAVELRGEPALRAGVDVVATGYPLSGLLADEVNVTAGIVSALAGMRNDRHVLQMTAPVQPGSSGGPLFDASGRLVGVVVTKLNARVVEEETGDIPQNVNFAVKASVLQDFLDEVGIEYRVGVSSAVRPRADIGDIGRQATVMVQCFR